MKEEFAYIYNSDQGIWYIKEGLIPIDFGTASKGDAYMKFLRDEKYELLFRKWCSHK